MCGIVGAIATNHSEVLDDKELTLFNSLLYCSALRGADSTGIMIWNGKHVDTLKAAWSPADFLLDKSYQKFLAKHKGTIRAIFGHTRYATVGKITTENSHPFLVKNEIIMMHNGAVRAAPGVEVDKFSVDSLALAHSLHINKDSKDTWEAFEGAAAAVWFDLRNRTLNLYRNYDRPLNILKGPFVTWLASEKDMLSWIINRAYTVDQGPIKELESLNVLTMCIDNFKEGGKLTKIERKYNYKTDFPFVGGTEHHPPAKIRNEYKYSDVKNESMIILVSEHGPFKKNTALTVCPYDKEEYKEGEFRILAAPLFTNDDTNNKLFNDTKCLIFVKGKDKAEEFFQAPLVRGVIKNIKYNRSIEQVQDRLVVYLGDAFIVK